jgi:hypothetical protein
MISRTPREREPNEHPNNVLSNFFRLKVQTTSHMNILILNNEEYGTHPSFAVVVLRL